MQRTKTRKNNLGGRCKKLTHQLFRNELGKSKENSEEILQIMPGFLRAKNVLFS